MSAYQVWGFDGRAPELLGSAPDKGSAKKLWANSRNAVIAKDGLTLEPKAGCGLAPQTALRVAVLAAWLAAGGAPPEPLPTPGSPSPKREHTPRKAARAQEDDDSEDDDEDEEPEEEDDGDGDDPDDPEEVDIEEVAPTPAQRQPSTPAPRASRAKRAPKAPQPSTPPPQPSRPWGTEVADNEVAVDRPRPSLSPKALALLRALDAVPPAAPSTSDMSPTSTADASPWYPRDAPPAPAPPTPTPTATMLSPTRGWVETTAACEACGRGAHRHRHELPEAFRALCHNDRVRARSWHADDPTRTPEMARDHVVAVVRARLATRAAAMAKARATTRTPRGRPPTPGWTKFRRDAEQLLRLASRVGGLEGLRALEATRRVDALTTVATASALTMAKLKASNCIEHRVQVDGREMLIIAQWADGKSPLALIWEARAERDAAVAALTAAQVASVRVRQLVDRAGGLERLESIVERFEGLLQLGGAR